MPESSAVILARRTPTDVLIADGAAAVHCTWRGLASSDGAEMTVEWSGRIAPVDSPADRELLAEQFLGAGVGATLDAVGCGAYLERSLASPLRRAVAAHPVDAMLRGEADAALGETISAEAKRVGFAVGLSVMSPFSLRIESPSVQRERKLAETRARAAAMAELDGVRARSLATLAQTLAELPDPKRATQVIADLRLGDPLDLLRAAAIADPTWSAPSPLLWIAAGDRLTSIDPTSPRLIASESIRVEGIGPLRSVRNETVDEQPVLLIGGRGGVAVLDIARRRVRSVYTCNTTSDFGFNGACVLPGGRLVATHSALGVVTWKLDEPNSIENVGGARACRSPLRCGGGSIVFIDAGRAAVYSTDGGLKAIDSSPGELAELERVDDATIIALASKGTCYRVDCGSIEGDWTRLPVTTGGGNSIDSIDLCGTPRIVALTAEGAVRIFDPHGGQTLAVGPTHGVGGARLVRARAGYIASVTADRNRVVLVDLAKPDASAGELHVAAILGHRVADCWFA